MRAAGDVQASESVSVPVVIVIVPFIVAKIFFIVVDFFPFIFFEVIVLFFI